MDLLLHLTRRHARILGPAAGLLLALAGVLTVTDRPPRLPRPPRRMAATGPACDLLRLPSGGACGSGGHEEPIEELGASSSTGEIVRHEETRMNKVSRATVLGGLLLGIAAARAESPDPVVQVGPREVLKSTPPGPRVEDKVRFLEQQLDELRAEVVRLKEAAATRPVLRDVGDPDVHPLWP
jgi:hypothetical protein